MGQMLQVDRVIDLSPQGIVCETDLAGHWVFGVHFPGDPIFPGSLIVEAAGQTIALWAWENGMRGDPRLVRVGAEFRSPVRPQDAVLTYSATIRRRQSLCVGRVAVSARGRQVALIEESLVVSARRKTDEREGG
ncbi:MAG: 3-hydroxyacyl-ACP dehydratase FabZ family protein [Gemmatimonadota bacterium]